MRTHMRYRLAGLVAAIALAMGTGYLVSAPAAYTNVAGAQACPDGTHWDTILKACS